MPWTLMDSNHDRKMGGASLIRINSDACAQISAGDLEGGTIKIASPVA